MSQAEWHAFLREEHTAVLATSGGQAFPHLVAMWYIPLDDGLWMWSYAKSQKVQNLRRHARVGVLVEAGERYDDLRGVLIQAEASIVEDLETVLRVGLGLHARYATGEPSHAAADDEAGVRLQARKRVAIHVPFTHIRSWDHRKLAGA